jgi:formate dehydrogenase maturation protein FdhE
MKIVSNPKRVCPVCGCEFTYTAEDVKLTNGKGTRYVNCPVCSSMLSVKK